MHVVSQDAVPDSAVIEAFRMVLERLSMMSTKNQSPSHLDHDLFY